MAIARTNWLVRLVAILALAASLIAAQQGVRADSAHATLSRLYVYHCNDVYVRYSPNGTPFDTLYKGQSFDWNGDVVANYFYGFAYGSVNAWGWVYGGCLSTARP
jgi:hypothetical protein